MTKVRWRALRSLVAGAALLVPSIALSDDNPAHSIADRFAHESDAPAGSPDNASSDDQDRQSLERKLEAEERLRADEAEMLERAKVEAEERKAADQQARRAAEDRRVADEAEDKAARDRAAKEATDIKAAAEQARLAAAKADAERRAAEEAKLREDDERKAKEQRQDAERKAAEEKRIAEEKAEAERKAAEDARIRVEEARKADEQRRLETAAAKEAEEKRLAAERAEADRVAADAARVRIEEAKQADALRRMEAEREEEARRLSEKLARAREQREAREPDQGYSALGNPPAAETSEHEVQSSVEVTSGKVDAPAEQRATILLIMEPGTRGIRRYEKTADPIICIGATCYIGGGVDAPAVSMTRARAFGPGNTLGQRAGACRHSLVCVFRDVAVGVGRFDIQPIDLRILRHDRRETLSAETDRTCTAAAGHLRCARGLQAGSYRVWIVPESVASRAGPSALGAALAAGLPAVTAAELRR